MEALKSRLTVFDLRLNHAIQHIAGAAENAVEMDFWQVLAPVLGPILISVLVVFLWSTGQPGFQMDWSIIVDVSPWALTFYTITLIGATMNDFWPKLGVSE